MPNILFIESGTDGGGSFESLYRFLMVIDRQEYHPTVVFLNSTRFVELIRELDIQVYVLTDIVYSKATPFWVRNLFGMMSFGVSLYFQTFSVRLLYLIHLSLLIKLEHIISEKKIDLLYLNGQINRDFYGVYIVKKMKLPCISHLRSMDGRSFNKLKVKWANQYISVFISNSEATKKYWDGRGVIAARNKVLYNAIEQYNNSQSINIRDVFQIPKKNSFIIGCVGRLIPLKGHVFLFEAFSIFLKKKPDAFLLVIGDGPIRDDLIKKANQLGIQENIIFTGYLKNVRSIMGELDLLVLPSSYDAFGRVLIEAMEQGTPVIGTNLFGIPEIIEHEYNGLLVEFNDVPDLANAIERMVTDKDLSTRCVANGKKTVSGKFSMSKYKNTIQNIISDVLKKNSH